jgi:hypothetical protein
MRALDEAENFGHELLRRIVVKRPSADSRAVIDDHRTVWGLRSRSSAVGASSMHIEMQAIDSSAAQRFRDVDRRR